MKHVMSGFEYVNVSGGATVFAEGDSGDCAYVIDSGRVLISIERNGEQIDLALLGPNELFGEMSIISDGGRSATATALEDCQLLRIGQEQFTRRLDDLDPVLRVVIELMLSRLRSTLRSLTSDIGSSRPAPRTLRGETPSVMTEAVDLLRLENEIARAIRNKELKLSYQPIVCLATGRLAGFEGLIRWHHPERGILTPDLFVPLAEQSWRITGITQACLDQALIDLPEMTIAALKNVENVLPPFVGINVTHGDLADPELLSSLKYGLTNGSLAEGSLKLEMTETSLMTNPEAVYSQILKLKSLGIGVAIDDFGTGYSSMSYLARLPIATLKIDKSFISSISECSQNRKIVNGILKLSHELGICVIAEGIEDIVGANYLAANACDFGQGYFYSKPVELAEAVQLINGWRAVPYREDGGEIAGSALERAAGKVNLT